MLLLSAASVQAEPRTSPWYLTAIVGAVDQGDQTLEYGLDRDSTRADVRYDSGLLTGAALGYRFADAWRAEAEFAYQSIEFTGSPFAGTNGPAGNGNHAATALAVNVYREFDLFGSPRVRTYTGLGLVYLTEVDIDFEARGQPESSFSTSNTGAQMLIGARYALGDRWFVDAGLRYLIGSEAEMDSESGVPGRIDARFEPGGLAVAAGWRF